MRNLISQFTINLNNPISTTLTQSEINPIIHKTGLITGIIFCLIYFICKYYGQKIALTRIENNLQKDEYVRFIPKFRYNLGYIFSFVIGGFLGTFIIPFFIYPDIQYIEPFSRSFIPLLIIQELIIMQFFFYFAFWKLVITNQRIIGNFAFRFIDNFITNKYSKFIISKNFKLFNINFSNISHLEIKTSKGLFISQRLFYLWLKDGTYKIIPTFKNYEEIKSFIESKLTNNI